ncbi:rhodanese-like domain-containing protein, partial [Bradyrhizobium sp.]|uniref:rhodanese-like domain-containing protein n=1 Tax=Bradyrhizobium sp. TaxID=376 RepID=UPI00391DA299
MSSFASISPDKLSRMIGTPQAPILIDVRTDEDFAADPRLIPGAIRRPAVEAPQWSAAFAGRSVIVICQRGAKLSHGAAAWRRVAKASAENLDGGF